MRSLATSYDQLSRDVVRTQLRIKALFRARGIPTRGQGVYTASQREEWAGKLPSQQSLSLDLLWQQLDMNRKLKSDAEKQLVRESSRFHISKVLETAPGFGPIRTALTIPVVVTPHRFRTSRQFWAYAGLGIVMRSSSDWVRREERWVRADTLKTRGLTPCFNHTLKYVFKGAATTVITKHVDSPLHKRYFAALNAETKPNLAKLTLARTIAAVFLSMWKNQEAYDPARHRIQ